MRDKKIPDKPYESFGRRLQNARKKRIIRDSSGAHTMTQAELADILHVSESSVRKWEQGTSFLTYDKLLDLQKVLGCSFDYLFGLEYNDHTDDDPEEIFLRKIGLSENTDLVLEFLNECGYNKIAYGISSIIDEIDSIIYNADSIYFEKAHYDERFFTERGIQYESFPLHTKKALQTEKVLKKSGIETDE